MALPEQLQTARMTGATLASNIPAIVGQLEQAIADILGVTINVNVTASALSATNAGVIAKALISQQAAPPVGIRIADSTNTTEFALYLNHNVISFAQNTGTFAAPAWTPQLTINLTNGLPTLAAAVTPSAAGDLVCLSALNTMLATIAATSYTDSLANTSGNITLVNDSASPGNSMYYGTNGSGVRGWLTFFPGAGVPLSTGSAWGTSYTVGTSAGDLVQLNGSAQLPAVDGSLLTNIGGQGIPHGMQLFTSSGTWTKPSGITKVWVALAGGGFDNSTSPVDGGYSEGIIAVTGSVTVTVGNGSQSGSGSAGTSSFAGSTTISATGGGQGGGSSHGSGSGGSINLTGGSGSGWIVGPIPSSGAGTTSGNGNPGVVLVLW